MPGLIEPFSLLLPRSYSFYHWKSAYLYLFFSSNNFFQFYSVKIIGLSLFLLNSHKNQTKEVPPKGGRRREVEGQKKTGLAKKYKDDRNNLWGRRSLLSGSELPWVLSIKYENGNYNRTWETASETEKSINNKNAPDFTGFFAPGTL